MEKEALTVKKIYIFQHQTQYLGQVCKIIVLKIFFQKSVISVNYNYDVTDQLKLPRKKFKSSKIFYKETFKATTSAIGFHDTLLQHQHFDVCMCNSHIEGSAISISCFHCHILTLSSQAEVVASWKPEVVLNGGNV